MKREDKDALLSALDRALTQSLKLGDKVTVTPNLPLSRQELKDPLKAMADKVAVEVKLDARTKVKFERMGSGAGIKFTKKF